MGTEFYLLRHGETAWNIEKVFRGRAEVPLNDNGREQARLAAEYYRDKGIRAIYASPLERAMETARIVGGELDLEPVAYEPFTGMDFGEWEGRPHTEVIERYPDLFELFHTDPAGMRVPGGETFKEVQDRGMAGLEELKSRHPDGTVLVVSHRVINKLLVLGVLGLGPEKFWQIKLETCSTCRFHSTEAGWVLTKVNDNHYLEGTKRVTEDF